MIGAPADANTYIIKIQGMIQMDLITARFFVAGNSLKADAINNTIPEYPTSP